MNILKNIEEMSKFVMQYDFTLLIISVQSDCYFWYLIQSWRSVQIDYSSQLSLELAWSPQKLTKLPNAETLSTFLPYPMINFKLESIH